MKTFTGTTAFTWVLAFLATGMAVPKAARAELNRREQAMVATIGATITRAGKAYFEGNYESSGNEIRKAMGQLGRAVDQGNPELFDALAGHIKKMSRAHVMLELEGVSLPPFRIPDRPSLDRPDADKPGPGDAPSSPDSRVSFTDQVAPILVGKCGQCHVSGNRGGFAMPTYAALMKGPDEGVVVFAGDAIGSRLVESIETGDMPRGNGKVSPDELETLKKWILQGAKFDGDNPDAPLAAGAAPNRADRPAPPAVTQATGKESVSFAFDVAPLLVDNCTGCHIDAMQNQGGLRMDSFAQLLRGGDNGSMIVPGRGEASLLIQKLRGTAADGQRMPAGGRSPLSDDSIALISKWIDEGAAIDADPSRPVKVISRLAWASRATSSQLTERRKELGDAHFKLADSSAQPQEVFSEHFRILGPGSTQTLELVGKLAEQHVRIAKSVAKPKPSTAEEDYFRGRATIFVLPRRYDYSEFAKMVEQRSVPADWEAHWQFDGIDGYIATVATERDEEEAIESRLMAPVISLAVATRGTDVPRWFAEGLGSATALQQNAKSRADRDKLQNLAMQAAASAKDAKAFLENRLTPEQTDSLGTALAVSMLERNRRKSLESCLRLLGQGKPFEDAFVAGFGVTPTVYIDQFLSFTR